MSLRAAVSKLFDWKNLRHCAFSGCMGSQAAPGQGLRTKAMFKHGCGAVRCTCCQRPHRVRLLQIGVMDGCRAPRRSAPPPRAHRTRLAQDTFFNSASNCLRSRPEKSSKLERAFSTSSFFDCRPSCRPSQVKCRSSRRRSPGTSTRSTSPLWTILPISRVAPPAFILSPRASPLQLTASEASHIKASACAISGDRPYPANSFANDSERRRTASNSCRLSSTTSGSECPGRFEMLRIDGIFTFSFSISQLPCMVGNLGCIVDCMRRTRAMQKNKNRYFPRLRHVSRNTQSACGPGMWRVCQGM